jgi:hypothetical protein
MPPSPVPSTGRRRCGPWKWIEALQAQDWPFEYQSLDLHGAATAPDATPPQRSSKLRGLYEHVRWPDRAAFEKALAFLARHPLGQGEGAACALCDEPDMGGLLGGAISRP